jgi:hypothetical protein
MRYAMRGKFAFPTGSTLCLSILCWLTAVSGVPLPAAAGNDVYRAIPLDAIVVLSGRPPGPPPPTESNSAVQRPETPSPLVAILSFLNAAGVVPEEGQALLDLAVSAPFVTRHEFAVALMDIRARRLASTRTSNALPSIRLDRLQAALVLKTDGRNDEVVAMINRVVGRHTNVDLAKLTDHVFEGCRFQRLSDDRLPDWAVWEWGGVGDLYVLGLGRGSFERIVGVARGKAPGLASDPWFIQARHRCANSPGVFLECLLGLKLLEETLGDVAGLRPKAILTELGVVGLERDFWAVGLHEREVTCRRYFRREGQDFFRGYAGDAALTARHARSIPPTAKHFAVLRLDPRWLVDHLPRAVVAGESASEADALRQFWARLEAEAGTDLSELIRNNLGREMIVCNYPPHPLGFPLALSVAVSVRDAEAVRQVIDTVLSAWQKRLESRRSAGLFRFFVVRTHDGIWYVRAGIPGPALKVARRYVVMSWSPQALREALVYFDAQP